MPRRKLLGLGGCVTLDGAHHLAIDPHAALEAVPHMGVEALFRTAHTGAGQVLVSKGHINTGDWALWIAGDGQLRWWQRDAAGTLHVCKGGPVVTDGQIHRASAWWDGATLSLLLDGQVVDQEPMAGPAQSTPALGLTLGDDSSAGRHLVGELDDVRVWMPPYLDAPIPTLDDLAAWALRQLPEDRRRHPRLYLRFGEGAGALAYDDSLHRHSATLVGPNVPDNTATLWSTLAEGDPEQRDQLRPLGLGTRHRVPGLRVGGRHWQISDVGVHGLGPVTEGGNPLRPRRSWTASDLTLDVGTGGLSPSLPVDWVRTAGAVDFGGLIRNQHVRVSTPTQSHRLRLIDDSTPHAIPLEGGVLAAEGPGVAITVETVGYQGTATDIAIDSTAGTLTTGGALQFIGQLAGDTFTLTGGANAGTYTLAENAKAHELRVVEGFATTQGPGVAITLDFDDPHEYTVDLGQGTAHLVAEPTLPLAFAYRGPLAAGHTRASILRWLAEYAGIDPAEIDAPAWDAFAAADPGTVGLWLAPDDDPTGRQAIDRLSHGASWGTHLLTGLLDVALRSLDPAPALELEFPRDFLELARHTTPDPIGGQPAEHTHNLVPLTDDQVAGRVRDTTPWQVAGLQAEHQLAEADINPTYAAAHPDAEPAQALPSHYQGEADARRGAQHLYDLDAAPRGVWRAVLPLGMLLLLDWRRQTVRITSPEHRGLEAGRVVLALSLTLHDAQHSIELYFWG